MQKNNNTISRIVAYGSIASALVIIGTAFAAGYDTLIAPKVEQQINLCIETHKEQQERDLLDIKNTLRELMKNQLELNKAVSRIEGKLEAR